MGIETVDIMMYQQDNDIELDYYSFVVVVVVFDMVVAVVDIVVGSVPN